MGTEQIVTIAVISAISGLLLVLSVFLFFGKGVNFIAGVNTMSKEEKAKYDLPALAKFMSLIVFIIALAAEGAVLAGVFKLTWLAIVCGVIFFGAVVFAMVYANTKNRFKKPSESIAKEAYEKAKIEVEKILADLSAQKTAGQPAESNNKTSDSPDEDCSCDNENGACDNENGEDGC